MDKSSVGISGDSLSGIIYIVQPLALANEYPTGNRLSQGAEVCFPALKATPSGRPRRSLIL